MHNHTDSYGTSLFQASYTTNLNSDSLIIDDINPLAPPLSLPPFPGSLLHSNRPPFSLITALTIKDGAYPYTQDLLNLRYTSSQEGFIPELEGINTIVTPLHAAAWEAFLQDHPDRALTQYILNGIRNGFHIGYDKTMTRQSSASNMISAAQNPEPVQKYVDNELAEQRIIGPFAASAAGGLTVWSTISAKDILRSLRCSGVYPSTSRNLLLLALHRRLLDSRSTRLSGMCTQPARPHGHMQSAGDPSGHREDRGAICLYNIPGD